MKERRKYGRKRTDSYISVFDCATDKQIGAIADITVQGIGIICDVRIEMGSVHELRLELPAEIDGIKEIRFTAKAVWCGSDVSNKVYRIGLIFDNISEENLDIVKKLLDSSIIKESVQRII